MNDGGPAFPFHKGDAVASVKDGVVTHYNIENPGMTLRDYFAAQALMGWFAGFEGDQPYGDVDTEANARLVYRQADAMLAERAK